jgi:hypothetical protein
MSDDEFEMMESELGYMQSAVERMSRPDGESFVQPLVECQITSEDSQTIYFKLP